MKTIGLLGGMSWESTVSYYQLLNQEVGRRLGGFHSARILLLSVDFQEIELLQHQGEWEALGDILARNALTLEDAGAEFLVLCTNTMHLVAPAIEAQISIPLLHIADATAERIKASGLERVGLLGTRFTMEEPFYKGRLEEGHGLTVQTPPAMDRELVHQVIYEELVHGRIREGSRGEFKRITEDLARSGAQGVILGCTEIGLLLKQEDVSVSLFDTTLIHAEAAAAFAVEADAAPAPREGPNDRGVESGGHGGMNAVRYYFALITLMSLAPAIFLWFLIHPFGAFWRRLGPWVTYTVMGLATAAFMAPVFLFRAQLLAVDFGTSYGTIALGLMAVALGSVIAVKRKRYLTFKILSGLPQVSAQQYPGILLTQGIYGTVRHPRYIEVVFWVLGYALFANFLALYVGFLLTVPGLFLIVLLEERELVQRFGDEWRDYAARVPRFIPTRFKSS